jgi:acyl-CoA reductase-like NAD-dependent aldehyde dehydrogenase
MATVNLLLANPLPCYVGGQAFVASASYDVVDPHAPSKVLHTVSSVTEADVVKVIESAEKAFPGWRDVSSSSPTSDAWADPPFVQTSVMDRRVIFLRAAALLRERLGEYAGLEYGETTSSGGWSGFEMTLAAASLEETAACATAALRGEIATTVSSQRAYIERCPFGIVFGMVSPILPSTLVPSEPRTVSLERTSRSR